ncbi:MAG: helix-turn-helix transcriptional regulator [Thermoleophilia bacterium]|nr:helix-turn-helix transcriptional regulator [Thermoleophilia bacterium]
MPAEDRCDLLCLDLPLAEELRARRLDDRSARTAAAFFQALADPTRLTIAAALIGAPELCVCDLAWIVERSQNLVSHHLRALRTAGLVDYRRDGKMALYALTGPGRALLDHVEVGQVAGG